MAHRHREPGGATSEGRLRWALALTASFLLVEVIASFLSGSLALLSDAAHMATDVAALGIALLAIRIGRRHADEQRSFGYRRLEIIAAALNATGLFVVAAYILYEAIGRFRAPPLVDSTTMLAVAAFGLVINMISMWLLRGGSSQSLNVRGAYLEVWSDFLGSIAVIVGAVLIRLTGADWIDAAIALLIAIWVLPRGWALLRAAMHVLLEGTPTGIDLASVRRTLLAANGVARVHDLHVWSLTTGVPLLSAHLEIEKPERWPPTLAQLREALAREHGILHVTLQPEVERCEQPSCELPFGHREHQKGVDE